MSKAKKKPRPYDGMTAMDEARAKLIEPRRFPIMVVTLDDYEHGCGHHRGGSGCVHVSQDVPTVPLEYIYELAGLDPARYSKQIEAIGKLLKRFNEVFDGAEGLGKQIRYHH